MAEKIKCPVCGKFEFDAYNSLEFCDVCDWCNDAIQAEDPDYKGGANTMSLNEAKEAYKKGETII